MSERVLIELLYGQGKACLSHTRIGELACRRRSTLQMTEIKSIPYVPLSHPFVERLIGTLRRKYLDRLLF
jgi:hypothetical protein